MMQQNPTRPSAPDRPAPEEVPEGYIYIPNFDGLQPRATARPPAVADNQLTRAAAQFRQADTNQNGRISRREWRSVTATTLRETAGTMLEEQRVAADTLYNFPTPSFNQYRQRTNGGFTYAAGNALVIDDAPLFDRAQWQAELERMAPFFDEQQRGRMEMPRGLDRVRISDVCRDQQEIPCQVLPNGRILIHAEASVIRS